MLLQNTVVVYAAAVGQCFVQAADEPFLSMGLQLARLAGASALVSAVV
jgi:hypothetical protein